MFKPLTFGVEHDEAMASRVRALGLGQDTADLIRAVRAFHSRADLSHVVREWPKPLLVVTGTRGTLQRTDRAAALAKDARKGKLLVMEGCGHFPNMERPREFNAALSALVNG